MNKKNKFLFPLLIFIFLLGSYYCYAKERKIIRHSPDGKYFLEIYADKKAILYKKRALRYLAIFKGNFIEHTVVFSPNSRFIACGSWENFARLYDIRSRKYIRSFIGHKDWISCLHFNPSGELLATGSLDRTAKLWNVKTGEELRNFVGHASYLTSVSFSPTGKYLITHAWDGSVKLWEVSNAREVASFTEKDSIVFGNYDKYKIIGKTKK